jgi:golgi SNAP receptor complex member 1
MASSTGNNGWAQLRQQARTLESQVSSHINGTIRGLQLIRGPDGVSISHLLAVFYSAEHPAETNGGGKDHRSEARGAPQQGKAVIRSRPRLVFRLTAPPKRENVITQLNRLLDSDATLTSSALKQNNLSLLREKLAAHNKDLARLKSNLSEARNRANLLSNVRDDIESYRASNPEQAEAEYMLEERRRVDRSHEGVDSVLSQAYAVQESFTLQRETLANINRRITLAASQVPGINSLIGRISARKQRDGVIMGSFVAFCFLMFWFFL